MNNYTANTTVSAKTYSKAIEIAGKQFDELWENGNWSVVSCKAYPVLNNALEPLAWTWDIEVLWHGQNKQGHTDE